MNEIEWWHPCKSDDNELDWSCDNLGDAQEVMAKMWARLCEMDPSLPIDGWRKIEDWDQGERYE